MINKYKIFLSFIIFLLLFVHFRSIVVAAPSASTLTKGVETDGNSTATTASVSPGANNLILVSVSSRHANTTPNAPTITGNNLSWEQVETVHYDTSGSQRRITLFRSMGTSPTTGTIAISFGGQDQTEVRWIVDQFSGVDTSGTNGSGAVVQSAINSNTSGSNNSLVVTLGSFASGTNATYGSFSSSGDNPTVGSGFTLLNSAGTWSDTLTILSEWKNSNDTSVDYSQTQNFQLGGIAVEIKSLDLSPTPSPTSGSSTPTPTETPTSTPTPGENPNRPDKTVIVWEENRKLQDVLGVGYFTDLANDGALFVQSFASFNPSQPNYIEFFAGTNLGVTNNTCPPSGSPFSANNIGKQFLDASLTFKTYAEDFPGNNTTCIQLPYVAHHLPQLWFSNIPLSLTRDFSEWPTDFSTLPTFSMVLPNNDNNSHDTDVEQAADWLETNIDSYKQWAMNNDSLLIVHFDEDDGSGGNLIYTVFVGPMIKKGIYNEQVSHKRILATIEDLYDLSSLTSATPITSVFNN